MARITSLILSDGTVRDVRDLGLDTADLENAGNAGAKTIGFNLYNAVAGAFSLGRKSYASAAEAQTKRSKRKGNYFSSFEAKVNTRRGTIELAGGTGETAQYHRYAVLTDGKFAPPSYESRNEAYRHSEGRGTSMVVKIGVKGNKVVSLSVG